MIQLLFLLLLNFDAKATGQIQTLRRECLIVRDVATGQVVLEKGRDTCSERFYPCSTFKVPLALMAFDSGALRDESMMLNWDGKKQMMPAWERDHNAYSWMKESVVWFSQALTPKIGMEKINAYLKEFHYGNQDFSGGITKAWLSSTLKISPREQLEFLYRLKKNELKIPKASIEKLYRILPVEMDRPEIKISGKTGTGFTWSDPALKDQPAMQIGWYIGFIEKGGKSYAFAYVFTGETVPDKFVASGPEAKRTAVRALEEWKP